MGPLERDIYELVTHNLATTNRSILAWVRVRAVDTTEDTIKVTLHHLVKRGRIRRIAPGIYRSATERERLTQEDVCVMAAAHALATLGGYTAAEWRSMLRAIIVEGGACLTHRLQ